MKRSHKELHFKFVSHGEGEYGWTGAFPSSFSHCVFWQSNKHHSNCVFVHVWVSVHHPAGQGMEAICLVLYLHCWSSAPIDLISNTDCNHFLCVTLAGGRPTRQRGFTFLQFYPNYLEICVIKSSTLSFLTPSSTNGEHFSNLAWVKDLHEYTCCHLTHFCWLTTVCWCYTSIEEEDKLTYLKCKQQKLQMHYLNIEEQNTFDLL